MIRLHLVGDTFLWVNPDYLIELRELPDGTCLVVQDHPSGVREIATLQTVRTITNAISYNC